MRWDSSENTITQTKLPQVKAWTLKNPRVETSIKTIQLLLSKPATHKLNCQFPFRMVEMQFRMEVTKHSIFFYLLRVVGNIFGAVYFHFWLARTFPSFDYYWQQKAISCYLLPFGQPIHFFPPRHSDHKTEVQVSHILFYVHFSYTWMLFQNKMLTSG